MMTLYKYAHVNDLVCQLTSNKSLRTFYILFLMAETDEERSKLNKTFNEASLSLEGEELNILKRDFTDSFKKRFDNGRLKTSRSSTALINFCKFIILEFNFHCLT